MNRIGIIVAVVLLALVGVGLGYFMLADQGGGASGPGTAREGATPSPAAPTRSSETPGGESKGPVSPPVKPVDVKVYNPREDLGSTDAGIAGTVQNGDGGLVDGATCELVVDNSALITKPQETDVRAQCTTRGDGVFFFPRHELASVERYVLRVSHPDYAVERLFPVELKDPKCASLRVVLAGGPSISGTVHGVSGAPLANVRVTAYDLNTNTFDPLGAVEKTGVSDAAGRYVIANVKPGVKKIMARLAGFATTGRQTLNVEPNKNVENVDLVMGEGCAIGGLITAADTGAPVAGALVTARPLRAGPKVDPDQAKALARDLRERKRAAQSGDASNGALVAVDEDQSAQVAKSPPPTAPSAMLTETVKTGEDGRYTIGGLECGSYAIGVAATGYMQPAQQTAETGSDAVNFQLASNGRVLGRVVDDESGRPVANFTIGFTTTPEEAFVQPQTKRSFGPPRFKDGAFEYTDLRPGKYWLLAEAPGYAGGRSAELVINQGERRDGVEIRLVKGATIRGRVINSQGQPVADAVISAETAPSEAQPDNPFMRAIYQNMRREVKEAHADAQGGFEITNVLEGRYSLSVRHPAYGPSSLPPLAVPKTGVVNAPDVVLSKGATIRGRVMTDGAPDPKATVQITANGTTGFGAAQRQAVTDSEGRYEVSGLAAGTYRISAPYRRGLLNFSEVLKSTSYAVTVTLTAGEIRELDL